MKKRFFTIAAALTALAASAQTLRVQQGSVVYLFPAAQTGDMPYTSGTKLTVMDKTFDLADVTSISVTDETVTDNTVSVAYSGTSATVTVSGNVAKFLTPTVSGAHVSIAQSSDLAQEITYTLAGTSSDGEFYTSGSYKATIELNGLTLTNTTPVYSGAAIHVQNGKRIKLKPLTGTTNTLVDAATGSQKGALYVKGHLEFAQKGTLNVTGRVKHAIKAGEYLTLKNATINVLGSAGDGINCAQYFLMESGAINISGVADDGLQVDLEGTTNTGQLTNHEDEDSGNFYLSGGTINITATGTAAKGVKCEGDAYITGGTLTANVSGGGKWDSADLETSAAAGFSADGNITISGGTTTLTATGSGGKGLKCDGLLTITDGTLTAKTTGALYYNNGTTENTNFTGNTDAISSNYYSAAKAIKAGTKTQSGSTYTYSGGIVISGGVVSASTTGRNAEGIESKNAISITGGHITVNSYDDAINAAQDLTIEGGQVYAKATNNDGIDANGNCYIKGGLVFAIGASSPELAIDANTEEQKKLYVTGGTLVAIGGLESGSSLTQSCYSTSSWSKSTWYALTYGNETFAFKTPTSGGTPLVVSASSTPTLKSGVTVSGGTTLFEGQGVVGGTVSGGSNVTLSSYSSNNSGPGGGGGFPGGGGRR